MPEPILAVVFGPLLAALTFTITDPIGDAHGDGTYVLPTRPALSADALDLREFTAQTDGKTMTFRVSFGAMQNPWQLPGGQSAAVTDIFVKTGLGGANTLPELNLNVNEGWQYHVRVAGETATLDNVAADGKDISRQSPPQVSVEGATLVVKTDIPAGKYGYWLTSSVYSPLTRTGLLAPGTQAGPAALSTARTNAPVPVDVLAPEGDFTAYTTHTLAAVGRARDDRPLLLGGLGGLGVLLTVSSTLRLWRSGRQ